MVFSDKNFLLSQQQKSSLIASLKYCALYPTSIVSLRRTCLPYVTPTGAKLPPWMHGKTFANGSLNFSSVTDENMLAMKPRLAPRDHHELEIQQMPTLKRMAMRQIHPYKLIYEEEGFFGLYRGFLMDVGHIYLKNLLSTSVLQKCYPRVRQIYSRMYLKIQALMHSIISSETQDFQVEAGYSEQCPEEVPEFSDKSWVLDCTHLFLRCAIETVLYPLMVMKNRMSIQEGPELLSSMDSIYYSYKYDGIAEGFFKGYCTHITESLIRDIACLMCSKLCDKTNCSEHDKDIILSGTQAIVTSATLPLSYLALLQSTQSRIQGLCPVDLSAQKFLNEMPWQSIIMSNIFTIFLTTFTSVSSLEASPASLLTKQGEQRRVDDAMY